jgi:type 2 lantibiotic, mersacidin/lichenicidin family
MKKNIDLARAWRDEDYYLSLTEEERVSLGAHPAGVRFVMDEILGSIAGGCCDSVYNCGSTPYCTPCGTLQCQA